MIRIDKFSPAERVATEIAYYLKEKGVNFVSLTLTFDDNPSTPCTYVNDEKAENQSFLSYGFTEDVNLKYRTVPSFKGTVAIHVNDEIGTTETTVRRFKVCNVLRCSQPYEEPGALNKNVFIGTKTYAAPEAQDAVGFKDVTENLRLEPNGKTVLDARSYEQYLLVDRVDSDESEEDYLILGPSWKVLKSRLFGYHTVDGKEFELSVDEDWAVANGFAIIDEPTDGEVVVKEGSGWKVFLIEDVFTQKFEFGSSNALFNGARWDGHALLCLLQFVAFVQLNGESESLSPDDVPWVDYTTRVIKIPVIRYGGRVYLSSELMDFIRKYVTDNQVLRTFMSVYGVRDHQITIEDKSHAIGLLTSDDVTEARTFVCCFARMMSLNSDYTAFFSAIKCAMDAELIVVDKGGLAGDTATKLQRPQSLVIDTSLGRINLTLQRTTLSPKQITQVMDGFFILKYKDDDGAIRFVVVERNGESLYLDYDPIQSTGGQYQGRRVDSLLDAPECELILLRDNDSHEDMAKWSWTR